jgi:hypothetical protein
MNPLNSGSVPAITGRVYATIGQVLGTIDRVPRMIGRLPATVGRMREEIAVEYHRSRALYNIRPHTYFPTLKFRRCVLDVSHQPIHHHITTK